LVLLHPELQLILLLLALKLKLLDGALTGVIGAPRWTHQDEEQCRRRGMLLKAHLELPCRRVRFRSCAGSAARLIGVTAGCDSINAAAGWRGLFRCFLVVGSQPKRRHVSATDVATAGT
jgi:hypothetical protein